MKIKYIVLLIMGITFSVDYETEIQPIFDNNCGNCHLGNSSGGLNLSNYDNVMAGGDNGDVIEPGEHANSYLWQRVDDGTMPPGTNPDLSADEIDLIAQWIDEGALETPAVDYAGPVWYVATTGSDEAGDGSEEYPFSSKCPFCCRF